MVVENNASATYELVTNAPAAGVDKTSTSSCDPPPAGFWNKRNMEDGQQGAPVGQRQVEEQHQVGTIQSSVAGSSGMTAGQQYVWPPFPIVRNYYIKKTRLSRNYFRRGALPAMEFLEESKYKEGSHGRLKENKECIICKVKFVDGVDVVRMPCSHIFHRPCLVVWLNLKNDCPHCQCPLRRG